jgi:repressor of nif and glnA expression
MIKLIMMLRGKTIMDTKAEKTATIDDVLDIAEYAISNGFADYARIEIDGETYVEYEV